MKKLSITALIIILGILAMGCDNTNSSSDEQTVTHTVTFNANDGSEVDSQSITNGGLVTKPDDPTRNGFTFQGWFSDSSLTNEWVFETNTVTEPQTLYAKWMEIIHMVTFETNGGSTADGVSTIDSQNIREGNPVPEPTAELTRNGYTFQGWFSDRELTSQWDFTTDTVTEPLTLYVSWDYDGGEFSVGDTGPAGGIVYYAKTSHSDGWRYLEVAPDDTANVIIWGDKDTEVSGTFPDLGKGKANTKAIVDKLGTDINYAARVCDELALGGYNDWFLPSQDELNELYNQKETVGNFLDEFYWSSTEYSSQQAWIHNFLNGEKPLGIKDTDLYNNVRAIRSF